MRSVAFMNGVGNFIFFTAALKILKRRGEKLRLLTDTRFLKNPTLMELSEGIFESIHTSYCRTRDRDILFANWSIPMALWRHKEEIKPKIRLINWIDEGIHEVQNYLDMIGASWTDFDGYMLEPEDVEHVSLLAKQDAPKIALANCADDNVTSRKRWDKFPELAEVLTDLGFLPVLLGLGDELQDCKHGYDLVDRLTLRQAAMVLRECDLLIASSTGLTVVADAVGTPVILLEGPMVTAKNHPLISNYAVVRRFISCAPCFQRSLSHMCNRPLCMEMIEVTDVMQKLFQFMPRMYERKKWWCIK